MVQCGGGTIRLSHISPHHIAATASSINSVLMRWPSSRFSPGKNENAQQIQCSDVTSVLYLPTIYRVWFCSWDMAKWIRSERESIYGSSPERL